MRVVVPWPIVWAFVDNLRADSLPERGPAVVFLEH